jgi:hypothetical protein
VHTPAHAASSSGSAGCRHGALWGQLRRRVGSGSGQWKHFGCRRGKRVAALRVSEAEVRARARADIRLVVGAGHAASLPPTASDNHTEPERAVPGGGQSVGRAALDANGAQGGGGDLHRLLTYMSEEPVISDRRDVC